MSTATNTPDPFRGNAPASNFEIEDFLAKSGIELPDDYVRFLSTTDGGCGFIGPRYVDLWPVSKLVDYNRNYEVEKYAPDLLLFGSDGGGEAFAFDRRHKVWPIVSVPSIPLDVREAVVIAQSFGTLFDALTQGNAGDSH